MNNAGTGFVIAENNGGVVSDNLATNNGSGGFHLTINGGTISGNAGDGNNGSGFSSQITTVSLSIILQQKIPMTVSPSSFRTM